MHRVLDRAGHVSSLSAASVAARQCLQLQLLCAAVAGLLTLAVGREVSAQTPTITSAVTNPRVWNDCATSVLTIVNNYPSLISIEDANLSCLGFANLHNWRLSGDGATAAEFPNNSSFRIAAQLIITGTGGSEAGLNISPWWSANVDGRFNVRTTDGEIACFGGRLPFFSFTANFGLSYVKGDAIQLAMTYRPNALSAVSPATITYDVGYNGSSYSSGPLPFDQGNPAEDPPHGLWGILEPSYVGGFIVAHLSAGASVNAKATFTDIAFEHVASREEVPSLGPLGLLALVVLLAALGALASRRLMG